MIKYIQLFRVHHWVKNLFIFIPVFFAGQIDHIQVFIDLSIGFLSFSLLASSVYIFNDLNDIQEDRMHPSKKFRPIASGAIAKKSAIFFSVASLILGLFLATFLGIEFGLLVLTYLVLNVFYTLILKKIPIIDMVIISMGFLLRIYGGGYIGEVEVSKWLVLMTFFLSMILALAKRRDDLVLLKNGINNRYVIRNYNLQFIDISMAFMVVIVTVSYIMYTISEEVIDRLGNDHIYLTSILVVLGMLRYLQQTIVFERSASPIRILLKDRFIQIVVLFWGLVFAFILYF